MLGPPPPLSHVPLSTSPLSHTAASHHADAALGARTGPRRARGLHGGPLYGKPLQTLTRGFLCQLSPPRAEDRWTAPPRHVGGGGHLDKEALTALQSARAVPRSCGPWAWPVLPLFTPVSGFVSNPPAGPAISLLSAPNSQNYRHWIQNPPNSSGPAPECRYSPPNESLPRTTCSQFPQRERTHHVPCRALAFPLSKSPSRDQSAVLEPPPGTAHRRGTGFGTSRLPPAFSASSTRSLLGTSGPRRCLWAASSPRPAPCRAAKCGWEAPGGPLANVPVSPVRVYSWRPREGKGMVQGHK